MIPDQTQEHQFVNNLYFIPVALIPTQTLAILLM